MKNVSHLLKAVSFTGLLRAQKSTRYKFTFNHLAISVKDVDRSAAFYKNILLLNEITNRTGNDGIRWFALGEGKELHLISILKEDFKINKAIHLAISTSRFDEFVKMLDDKRIAYSDWPGKANAVTLRADGIKQIYLQDPDGYWIEVNNVEQ